MLFLIVWGPWDRRKWRAGLNLKRASDCKFKRLFLLVWGPRDCRKRRAGLDLKIFFSPPRDVVSYTPSLDHLMPKTAYGIEPLTSAFALTGHHAVSDKVALTSTVAHRASLCVKTLLCNTLLPDITQDKGTLKNSECIFFFSVEVITKRLMERD